MLNDAVLGRFYGPSFTESVLREKVGGVGLKNPVGIKVARCRLRVFAIADRHRRKLSALANSSRDVWG